MTEPTFDTHPGTSPIVLSAPHCGTALAPGLAARLSEPARSLRDTDWHIPRLYDFVHDLDATVISARFSRYVVDLNRPPSGESLYPGQATTGLCPDVMFDGTPLYREGEEPDAAEIAARVQTYWQPYHDALTQAIQGAVARHGFALLYDAHSIASEVPRLFPGTLPVLNLGTVSGQSCPPPVRDAMAEACFAAADAGYDAVVDGRFIGGFITRNYGKPEDRVFAVQMELAQAAYMDETAPPFPYDERRAAALRPVLQSVIERFLAASRSFLKS